jgi:curved DNA-binding protein CbpA
MTGRLPGKGAMAVEFKDYYKILGVPPTATGEEIKKAFRALARKHHPDVAKDKKSAEEKFKEINEANEVLSNPESRKRFDQLVRVGKRVPNRGHHRAGPEPDPTGMDRGEKKTSSNSRARDSVISSNSFLVDAPEVLAGLRRSARKNSPTETANRRPHCEARIFKATSSSRSMKC